MSGVVVVGSANIDLVVRCAVLPVPGETVLGTTFHTIPGGKGANQAIAAARAGASCALIAAVGDDPYGSRLRATLSDAGVRIDGVRTVAGPSGTALISVDDSAANTIIVVPGANGSLTGLTDADLATIAAADVMLAQLEIPLPTVHAALEAARTAGTLTVLNAAPARELDPDLLALVDLLVVNESEAATLGDDRLLTWVPSVIVTAGAEGAAYRDRVGGDCTVRPPEVTAVDTTAAGDTFTGALATALGDHRPIEEALRFASAAASLSVEHHGASSSIPGLAAIEDRYRAAYGDV